MTLTVELKATFTYTSLCLKFKMLHEPYSLKEEVQPETKASSLNTYEGLFSLQNELLSVKKQEIGMDLTVNVCSFLFVGPDENIC